MWLSRSSWLGGGRGAGYASNSLGSSLGTDSPPLFLGFPLLFSFSSLSTRIHDHLRRAYVGAVGLRDRHGASSRAGAAIGSATAGQVGHERVLLHQVGREGVGNSEGLLKHKPDRRSCTTADSEGRMGFSEGARARTWCLEAYKPSLLFRGIGCLCAFKVWRPTETICRTSGRAACSRMVVLRPIVGLSFLLA